MKLSAYLRKIRTAMCMTRSQVARSLGVSEAIYLAIELERRTMRISEIPPLEEIFNIPQGTISKYINGINYKKVYISHPLRGDERQNKENTVRANINKISKICEKIAQDNKDILILSPIHAFSFLSCQGDQSIVLQQCRAMLELADEMWVYGDWGHSEGCKMEIDTAKELKIPVIFKESEK